MSKPLNEETAAEALAAFRDEWHCEPNFLFLANDVLDDVVREHKAFALNVLDKQYTVFTRPEFTPKSWWLGHIEGRCIIGLAV